MRLDSQFQEEKLGAHACERAAGMEEDDGEKLRNCYVYNQYSKQSTVLNRLSSDIYSCQKKY